MVENSFIIFIRWSIVVENNLRKRNLVFSFKDFIIEFLVCVMPGGFTIVCAK
jgi:hypothetical protein